MTNLTGLFALDGLVGSGEEGLEPELSHRLQQTKSWAAWAPGLVSCLVQSLEKHVHEVYEGSGEPCETWSLAVRSAL